MSSDASFDAAGASAAGMVAFCDACAAPLGPDGRVGYAPDGEGRAAEVRFFCPACRATAGSLPGHRWLTFAEARAMVERAAGLDRASFRAGVDALDRVRERYRDRVGDASITAAVEAGRLTHEEVAEAMRDADAPASWVRVWTGLLPAT